jgi:Domain of unknown function (DUF4276)
VSIVIFVEGGGDKPTIKAKCRKGFAEYCKRIPNLRVVPSFVACGGRDQAFKRFRTAVENGRNDEVFVLLVDAEGTVSDGSPLGHLSKRDPSWRFPNLKQHRVFLMVQAMEAWFLADREALEAFYGAGFLTKSLPGTAAAIESIPKIDLESKLNHAAKPTSKSEYHKTKHGFALLALIDPAKVENASPNAAALHQFLREQIP